MPSRQRSQRSKAVNLHSRDVRDTVNRSQHRRQRVIFAVQVLFGCNIALVYGIAAHASIKQLIQGPALLLFSSYALMAIWCLNRSAHRRLKWIDVALSIVLDYALLTLVTFQQSGVDDATVLLSTPLFSYVYLFIAMRALHYRQSYVHLAGTLASAAWILLLFATSTTSGADVAQQLHDLTFRNAVLSGALDKLLSIIAVTAVLGLCAKEARKHLYASAIRGAAGKGLARMVGEQVTKEVLFSRDALIPGRGRKQTVAILMMDIRNFTKLANKSDPSDVMKLLAKYQQLVEPVILKYGGIIDKYMGDGIMAHFGAIDPSPHFVANALRCVEHLIYETDRWNGKRIAAGFNPLGFRVACAVGDAVVGLVGGASKVEFTIIGDPVNVTAKLEKHAKKLGARGITTQATYEYAQRQGFKAQFPVRKHSSETIGGVEKPMDLVVLAERRSEARKEQSSTANRVAAEKKAAS